DAGTSDAGTIDADQSSPPDAPTLLAPANGAFTGSVWADGALRPRFRWHPVANASSYELQVEDTCPVIELGNCGFPSPEVSEVGLTAGDFQLAVPLPVSTTVPVGRRYYWRVRACNIAGCSDWSATRYLNVGRLGNDFNGDGYADRV